MKRTVLLIIFYALPLLSCIATNRALLIGIGRYDPNTGWRTIHGDADIELLKPLLKKHGFKVNTLINEEATKDAIIDAFYRLLEDCETGDKIYIHFSGHGQRMEDINGDEDDGLDEAMVPFDAGKYYENDIYEGNKHFIDDDYNWIITRIKEKVGATGEIFIAVDACYSRSIERGEYNAEDNDIPFRGTADDFTFDGKIPNSFTDRSLPKAFGKGAKLFVVTACKEDERNYEYKAATGKIYGSLSFCIAKLLREDADFNKWSIFFQENRYRKLKIFQTSQHPSITIYD